MNLPTVIDTAFSARLILTLAHFLWQGTIIFLLVVLMALLLRRASANARYGVFVAALLLMAACPPLTFLLVGNSGQMPATQQRPASPLPVFKPAAEMPHPRGQPSYVDVRREPTSSVPAEVAPHRAIPTPSLPPTADTTKTPFNWQRYAPHAAIAYVLGTLVMFGRLLLSVYGGRRLRRRSLPVEDVTILTAFARQARALGLRFTPAIAYCRSVCVPTVIGVLRPMILLPIALASGLTPEQIEVLLTHELAHIRRYDHLVNLLQRLIEAALFFHPAVWFVSRRIRIERELCCDDRVIAAGGQRFAYAESLVRMAELSRVSTAHQKGGQCPPYVAVAALGADGQRSQLGHRIMRLIVSPAHEHVRLRRTWLLTLPIMVVAALTVNCLVPSRPAETSGHYTTTQAASSAPRAVEAKKNNLTPRRFTELGFQPLEEPVVIPAATRPTASTLEFRIVPNDEKVGRKPVVKDLKHYRDDLETNGPSAGRERGDEFQWFVIADARTTLQDQEATQGGLRYALLCDRDPYVMRLPKDGLRRVAAERDSTGRPFAFIEFDDAATKLFFKLTKANLGNRIAMLIDGKVVIVAGGQISGSFTPAEINRMVAALSPGLPAATQPASTTAPAGAIPNKFAKVDEVADALIKYFQAKEIARATAAGISSLPPTDRAVTIVPDPATRQLYVTASKKDKALQPAHAESPADNVPTTVPSRTASLTIRFDIPGAEDEGEFHLYYKDGGMSASPRTIKVRNGGEVTVKDLLPGNYEFFRLKLVDIGDYGQGIPCDRHDLTLKSGEQATVEVIRKVGQPLEGELVGGYKSQTKGAFVVVRPAADEGLAIQHHALDHVGANPDGTWKTSIIPPGDYVVMAEAYEPETVEFRSRSGIRVPNYTGRARVTVPKEGKPPRVRIQMKSRTTLFAATRPAAVNTTQKAAANPETNGGGSENTLAWGRPVNGLRAAVELWPAKAVYSYHEQIGVLLHVQNVSDHTIQFVTEAFREDRPEGRSEDGATMRVNLAVDYSGVSACVRHNLEPGQKAVLDNYGLAAIENEDTNLESLFTPAIRYALKCPPGRYAIRYTLEFQPFLQETQPDGEPLFMEPDDWFGELITDWRGLIVQRQNDEPSAALTGNVRWPDGTPVAGAEVVVVARLHEAKFNQGQFVRQIHHRSEMPVPGMTTRTDAAGRFSFRPPLSGDAVAVAHDRGYAEVPVSELAKAGSVTLQPWGRVEGTALWAGKPDSNRRISVISGHHYNAQGLQRDGWRPDAAELHHEDSVCADGAGHFTFEKVPPGKTWLRRESSYGILGGDLTVDVQPGKTADVVVGTTRSFSARLTAAYGSGLVIRPENTRIHLFLDPPPFSGPIDAIQEIGRQYSAFLKSAEGSAYDRENIPLRPDGSFEVLDLPPAKYFIQIRIFKRPVTEDGSDNPTVGWLARSVDLPVPVDALEGQPLDLGIFTVNPVSE